MRIPDDFWFGRRKSAKADAGRTNLHLDATQGVVAHVWVAHASGVFASGAELAV